MNKHIDADDFLTPEENEFFRRHNEQEQSDLEELNADKNEAFNKFLESSSNDLNQNLGTSINDEDIEEIKRNYFYYLGVYPVTWFKAFVKALFKVLNLN